jgi:hypothetical protein
MRLDRPAKLAPNVGRICLPRPGLGSGLGSGSGLGPGLGLGSGSGFETLTPPDTLATVVGWGRLGSDEADPHSNVLQAVAVPLLSDEQCQYETGLPLYNDQVILDKNKTFFSCISLFFE